MKSAKQPRVSDQIVQDSFRLRNTNSPEGPKRRQQSQKLEVLQNSLKDVAKEALGNLSDVHVKEV